MQKVYYNKLVRDKIKAKIEGNGEACAVRVVEDDSEFETLLRQKLIEEVTELAAATDRAAFLKEYADLMVALDALTAQLEFTEADIKVAMEENVAKKGLFKERHFLHWAEHPDTNKN